MNAQLRYFFHLGTAELYELDDYQWALLWQHLVKIRKAEATQSTTKTPQKGRSK